MGKTGRNAPCPCGSGKKYKTCCLPGDQAGAQLRTNELRDHEHDHPYDCPDCGHQLLSRSVVSLAEADALDELSNGVVDLIRAGRFDEAENACRELREMFPDQIDWLERGAMLAEARGDKETAADLYRRCLDFTWEHDGFDDDSRSWMLEEIVRLDPHGPRPELRRR